MLKVSSRNTRKSCEICSKSKTDTQERIQCRSNVVPKKIKHFSFDPQNLFNLAQKNIPKDQPTHVAIEN